MPANSSTIGHDTDRVTCLSDQVPPVAAAARGKSSALEPVDASRRATAAPAEHGAGRRAPRSRRENVPHMSRNAIYDGDPYHLIDVVGHEVVLKPVEDGRGQ